MLNLAFLPATEPDDNTYGRTPDSIPGTAGISIRQVSYPRLVWYNTAVRNDAIEQIRAWNVAPIILVGFSKSGLGAWNIARTIPELVSGTIIFDAPVARQQLPPWGTQPFYPDDSAWQADLPLRTTRHFLQAMPDSHQLVLIAGANFRAEMCMLSEAMLQLGSKHAFLDRPDLKHHWNSGWIEVALNALLGARHRPG